ncbi:MAG TPA: hypothetical protein VE994_03250 [Terriglobales bacterium]|nr:hypothetical protein [Terriglobales bacterium]
MSSPNGLDVGLETKESDIREFESQSISPQAAFVRSVADKGDVDAPFAPTWQCQDLKEQVLAFVARIQACNTSEIEFTLSRGWPRRACVVRDVEWVSHNFGVGEVCGELYTAKFEVSLRDEIRRASGLVGGSEPLGHRVIRPPLLIGALGNYDIWFPKCATSFHPSEPVCVRAL